MNLPSPEHLQHQIEQRLRTIRILWGGMFMSLVLFYIVSRVNEQPRDMEPNSTLTLIFIAVALVAIPVSFIVKSKVLRQSVEQQRPELVHQAYIIALAINEVGALLGLLDHFLNSDPYYFVPMIIAACGELLHFPQRQHMIDASFKT